MFLVSVAIERFTIVDVHGIDLFHHVASVVRAEAGRAVALDPAVVPVTAAGKRVPHSQQGKAVLVKGA